MVSVLKVARRLAGRTRRFVRGSPLHADGKIFRRKALGAEVRWLIFNEEDEIQAAQLSRGFYELDELKLLANDVGTVRSVLDVGANVGNHSVFFAVCMGATKLQLVEPYPLAVRHLLNNLALNCSGLDQIAIHRCALGDRAGISKLVPPTEFNIGLTRVGLDGEGVPVEIVRGDDLGIDDAELIKIDVEGGELSVLRGLEQLLRRTARAIYVEVSLATHEDVVAFLEGLGFSLRRSTPAYESQFNLTFLKNVGLAGNR